MGFQSQVCLPHPVHPVIWRIGTLAVVRLVLRGIDFGNTPSWYSKLCLALGIRKETEGHLYFLSQWLLWDFLKLTQPHVKPHMLGMWWVFETKRVPVCPGYTWHPCSAILHPCWTLWENILPNLLSTKDHFAHYQQSMIIKQLEVVLPQQPYLRLYSYLWL